MTSNVAFFGLSALAIAISGCAAEGLDVTGMDEGNADEAVQAIQATNGIELNGAVINGTSVNGISVNGLRENGLRENGLRENGTGLEATDESTGLTITGTGLQGTYLTATLTDESQVTLYIDEVRTNEIAGKYTYIFKLNDANGINICINDASATAINGRYDYTTGAYIEDSTQFSIACRGAALAKCVELGYRVNNGQTNGITNKDLHQACTRMIRADYCGNGTSTTHDGTLVDIWDEAGIQLRTTDPTLKLEAEWGPDGAKCINHKRWVSSGVGDVASYVSSTCSFRAVPCGSSWGDGVLRNASGQTDHDATTFTDWTW